MFEIGSSLREARLRQSVELPEAEAATKIRAKYLRALEDEHFEVLPAQTYVKGFLRAYAEFLGLDGQLYVDEFNSRYVTGEDEPVVHPRRGSSVRATSAHRRIESSVVALALIGIATAAALVIVAWKWGGENPRASVPGVGGETTTAARATQQQRQPPATAFAVELLAVGGPTRVTVRRGSATGDFLFDGTIEAGRSQGFTQKRVWVDVAIPRNLVVKVNGMRLGALRNERVIVSPQGVRPLSS